jgi:TonB family protein
MSVQPVRSEGAPPLDPAQSENALPPPSVTGAAGTTALPRVTAGATATHVPEGEPQEPQAPAVASLGHLEPCRLIHSVQPVYPQEAKEQHLEGNVELRVVVGTDGTVESVRVISGLPLLASAAMDAARGFRYTPAFLNGRSIETIQTVDMSFKLKP